MSENQEESHDKLAQQNSQNIGNYRLLKKLGAGGMGTVYLAEDTIAQRQVAMKVLPRKFAADKNFLTRFHREAKALGKLNHENIVAAFSFGEEQGHHFYVMEYCDGEPLDKILKQQQHLTFEKALQILIPVTRGLIHAHGHNLIHRDIKPANIIITSDGVPKILDLGLSKSTAESDNAFTTQSGVALGTPHYISPEQARGDKDVDLRADIYSLGATLFHLITGQTPYDAPTSMSIMARHLSDPVPNPRTLKPELPESATVLIQKMMAKSAEQRYQNCTDLLADLERAQNGQPLSAGAGISQRRKMKRTGSHKPVPDDERGDVKGLDPDPPQHRRTTKAQTPVTDDERPRRKAAAAVPMKQVAIAGGAIIAVMLVIIAVASSGGPPNNPVAQPANTKPKPPEPEPPKPDPTTETPAQPISVPEADPREGYAQRMLDGIKADEAAGKLAGDALRVRLQEIAERHDSTRAGKEAAERLKTLPPLSPAATTQPSQMSQPVSPTQKEAPGLRLAIYDCGKRDKLPDFKTLQPAKVRDWPNPVVSHPEMPKMIGKAEVALLFSGYVNAPKDGDYIFTIFSDDGSQLFVDDKLLIDHDGCHGYVPKDGTVKLKAGKHPIAIHYFNSGGSGNMAVQWSGPGFNKQIVPVTALTFVPEGNMPLTVVIPWFEDWKFVGTTCRRINQGGRSNVMFTHPNQDKQPARWTRRITLTPATCRLKLDLSAKNDFVFIVLVSGKEVFKKVIDSAGWQPVEVKLDDYTGKEILIEMQNAPGGKQEWSAEDAYWDAVRFEAPGAEIPPGLMDPKWIASIEKLPVNQQVAKVEEKLKQINPDFEEKIRHSITEGKITELTVPGLKVTYIWPIAALRNLERLTIRGARLDKQNYLSPVSDLSPLKGLRLTNLNVEYSNVADLTPLKDMPLKALNISTTKVASLTPLKSVQLTHLYFSYTPVTDISPLAGMPVAELQFYGCRVADLSVLKDLPVKDLRLDMRNEKEVEAIRELVRSMKNVEKVNGQAVADFLQPPKPKN